jgi:hypothetical protein
MPAVIDHTKHGAVGHRVIVQFSPDEIEASSRETLKAATEGKALLHCAKVDSFPKGSLTSQALPMRGPGLWSAWVRVTKRPAPHPWNEEHRLRESEVT